jgi:hypothetical protein
MAPSQNEFAFAKTGGVVKKAKMCVAPCGTPTDTTAAECAGSTCPTTPITYKQGDYKFSVYLASKDSDTATAANNWEHVKNTYGTGTTNKTLEGDFYVDQVIDFSNMGADTLKITKPDGTTVMYKDMVAFTGSNAAAIYPVQGVKVSGDGFIMDYSFPASYNQGDWSNNGDTITVARTKKVKIFCVRASNADLVKLMSDVTTEAQAANKKVVLFRYQFDLTGIEGTQTSGKWMAYDPTVKSGTATSGTSTATGSGVTNGSNGLLPSCLLLASAIVFLLLKD